MNVSPTIGGDGAGGTSSDDPAKELLWPPNGYVYDQEFMLPAYCKPKLIPLKSVTLEKLEKMQAENVERMRKLEREEQERQQRKEEEMTSNGTSAHQGAPDKDRRADIWRADE